MTRTPSPLELLFIAEAALNLADGILSRGQSPISPYDLEGSRRSILIWAWRLRRALDPFWRFRDPPVVGWPDYLHDELFELYYHFRKAYQLFAFTCYQEPDHPITTTWFREIAPADDSSDVPLSPTSEAPPEWDSTWIGRGKKALIGKTARSLFCAFEDRTTINELRWGGRRLKDSVWRELHPSLFQTCRPKRDLPASNDDPDPALVPAEKPRLTRDGLACAAWHDLVMEGKTPTFTEVARRIGCHRTTLKRLPHFMALVTTYQQDAEARKRRMPRGFLNRQTGSMDALLNDGYARD